MGVRSSSVGNFPPAPLIGDITQEGLALMCRRAVRRGGLATVQPASVNIRRQFPHLCQGSALSAATSVTRQPLRE